MSDCKHVSVWEMVDGACPKCGMSMKAIECEILSAWMPKPGDPPVRFAGVDRTESPLVVELRGEVERLRGVLEEIAAVTYGDMCYQLPYWAKWALEGKDTNGDPVAGPSRGDE